MKARSDMSSRSYFSGARDRDSIVCNCRKQYLLCDIYQHYSVVPRLHWYFRCPNNVSSHPRCYCLCHLLSTNLQFDKKRLRDPTKILLEREIIPIPRETFRMDQQKWSKRKLILTFSFWEKNFWVLRLFARDYPSANILFSRMRRSHRSSGRYSTRRVFEEHFIYEQHLSTLLLITY